jgi:uncharacterized protein DUF3866
MLRLRRGTVVEAGGDRQQALVVELADGRHRAVADVGLIGPCEPGDEVIVNVEARELGLGSGGFDIVHVNLTRGLDGKGRPGADVMKLNYTSLQHATVALEAQAGDDGPAGGPPSVVGAVAVIALHGQLAPLAWALGQARPGCRLGYVQTGGGALPGSHSEVVRALLERGLLASHVTAGAAYGAPDGDAITTIGAVHHGLAAADLDAVVCGPGPGIIGSGSTLGHGGMVALDSAHAGLSLGAGTLVVPRMSTGDRRPRHQGISHHSRTVLELVLGSVSVALPPGADPPAWGERHTWIVGAADLAGYGASGLPASTMGRSLDLDPVFFAVALAAGEILAGM